MSISSEITSMGENLKKDYQSIANLGADLTNVDKNIENIAELLDGVYDNLPKTEYQEGTEITLENCLKGKLDFDNGVVGIGQSSQESTQGYNLLELKPSTLRSTNTGGTWDNDYTYRHNGITFTIDYSTGKIKASGTSSGVAVFGIPIVLTQGNSYRISGCPSGGGANSYRAYMIDTTAFSQSINDDGSGAVLQSASYTNYEYRCRIASGYAANNIVFEPMVIDGSTAKTFEKYTGGQASPNPSYPQEIKCVKGKNLFDKNTATKINGFINYSTSKFETLAQTRSVIFPCKPNTTYTISKVLSARFTTGDTSVDEVENGVSVSNINHTENTTSHTITTSGNAKNIIVFYYLSTTDTLTEQQILDSIQIEQGTQATPYLPYNTIEEVVSGKNYWGGTLYNGQTNGVGVWSSQTSRVTNTSSGTDKSTLKLKAGTYTLSIQNLNNAILLTKDENGNILDNFATYWRPLPLTFELTQEGYVYFSAKKSDDSNITPSDYFPMIANGTDTTYEPYITPTSYQLSLGDIELNAIGNYKDELIYDVDEDKVYKNKNVNKRVFDETTFFQYDHTNAVFYCGITDRAVGTETTQNIYCDKLFWNGNFSGVGATSSMTKYQIACNNNGTSKNIFVKNTDYNTANTFNGWLISINASFYYPLAEAVQIPITDTTLINQVKALYNAHSNNGTTIITSNGNLPMIIKCRGLKGGE